MTISPRTADQTVYISFNCEINNESGKALVKLLTDLSLQGVNRICLLISSSGGTVSEAIRIANFMSSLPAEISTHNIGYVNSAANIIFQAGSKRTSSASATTMLHGLNWTFSNGPQQRGAITSALHWMDQEQQNFNELMSRRTNLTAEQLDGFNSGVGILTSEEALKHGLIDEIVEIQIPNGAQIHLIQ